MAVDSDVWRIMLISALALNGVLGLGYRIYRLRRGGPLGDVLGQGILAVLLAILIVALVLGAGWPRWPALAYGLLFGVVVMPVWTLAVLIPLPPGAPDYAFTTSYWASLAAIVVAAVAL